jgi:hypothetical protein
MEKKKALARLPMKREPSVALRHDDKRVRREAPTGSSSQTPQFEFQECSRLELFDRLRIKARPTDVTLDDVPKLLSDFGPIDQMPPDLQAILRRFCMLATF